LRRISIDKFFSQPGCVVIKSKSGKVLGAVVVTGTQTREAKFLGINGYIDISDKVNSYFALQGVSNAQV
jgi:uncharacterized protein (UPF0303 family)